MIDRLLYLAGVVAVGSLVTVGLRALPFLLFAGRKRELPRWVESFGSVVSPIIIACLIVYSYSGLEWKTIWPYAAGMLTIGLQLCFRNPLVSIIAGTLVYMCALNCGCTTHRTIELDAKNPMVRVSVQGVMFGDTFVKPQEVSGILEDYDVPHERVIHIRLDKEVTDLRPARFLMACLSRAGYTRPVLVTERHAESLATGKKPTKRTQTPKSTNKRTIRYKKANE